MPDVHGGGAPADVAGFTTLDGVGALDDLVFQDEDAYGWDPERVRAFQDATIPASFAHHFACNPAYGDYCLRLGVTPERIQSAADAPLIPLLTSSRFKLSDVLSCDRSTVIKSCTSSGTMGSISQVHRDETTLSRFMGSVLCCFEQLLDIDDAYCLHLGPSTDEAKDLWIAYAMSLFHMVHPTENFVTADRFDPAKVVRTLRELPDYYEHVMLVGAPVMFLHLLRHLEQAGEKVVGCERLVVVTGGGWKRFSGAAIGRRDFEQRLAERLIGLEPARVRDIYNMVELNTVMAECEHHVKHVPPWLAPLVVDPSTLDPLPVGEVGLLAFIDPTPTSYPGFLLSEDFGRVSLADGCACGRRGQGIEVVRRMKSVDARGCALKLDHGMEAQGLVEAGAVAQRAAPSLEQAANSYGASVAPTREAR